MNSKPKKKEIEKQYCANCSNVFDPEQLKYCICDSFMPSRKRMITTKYGVKNEEVENKYCRDCIFLHHGHAGEIFI